MERISTFRIDYTIPKLFIFLPLQSDLADDGLFLVIDMHLGHMGCRFLILFDNAFVDHLMFLHEAFMLAAVFDVLKPVTVHLLRQIIHQLDQALVPRSFHNDIMQCHIRLCDLFHIFGLHRLFKDITCLFQMLQFFL